MKRILIVSNCCVLALAMIFTSSCRSKKEMVQKQDNQSMQQPPQMGGPNFAQNGNPPSDMPPGPPPGGFGGQNGKNGGGQPMGMPPGGMGGNTFDAKIIKAALSLSEGDVVKKDTSLTASETNESALYALSNATVELSSSKLSTTGNTTSQDNSSFQGLNAAVLGRDSSVIKLVGNDIETTGLGANAVFAYGKSVIYSDKDIINCTGNGGHGIMCSGGGVIHATNVDITTAGKNSAAVATDRGSGVITVEKGKILTKGQDSPGLYSTGKLSVADVDIESTGSEVAVIEGSNSILIKDSKLRCTYPQKWGVMIYQSFSGDADGADGEFQLDNSSLEDTDGQSPLFFVTNSTAYITLKKSVIHSASGILLNAASSRWGNSPNNGGTAVIKAESQSLEGNLNADANSQIKLTLSLQSTLTGSVDAAKKAKFVSISIDDSSVWNLTADSYVTQIDTHIVGDEVENIKGNGHTLFYSSSKNPALGGKTYQLQGGGFLKAL